MDEKEMLGLCNHKNGLFHQLRELGVKVEQQHPLNGHDEDNAVW